MAVNFYKLFSPNIKVKNMMSQNLFSITLHQIFVNYKNHKFLIIIQEDNTKLKVLQINYTTQYKASIDPMQEYISAPISVQEFLSPITPQTLTNFEFNEEKICAIFDKIIGAKINFNKIDWAMLSLGLKYVRVALLLNAIFFINLLLWCNNRCIIFFIIKNKILSQLTLRFFFHNDALWVTLNTFFARRARMILITK